MMYITDLGSIDGTDKGADFGSMSGIFSPMRVRLVVEDKKSFWLHLHL